MKGEWSGSVKEKLNIQKLNHISTFADGFGCKEQASSLDLSYFKPWKEIASWIDRIDRYKKFSLP